MLPDDLADIARMRRRIMYIEDKSDGLSGPARIGRVPFSKTGRTLYYAGRRFHGLKGAGFKASYVGEPVIGDLDPADDARTAGREQAFQSSTA